MTGKFCVFPAKGLAKWQLAISITALTGFLFAGNVQAKYNTPVYWHSMLYSDNKVVSEYYNQALLVAEIKSVQTVMDNKQEPFSEVKAIFEASRAKLFAYKKDYERELTAAGRHKLLDVERIATDKDGSEAKAILHKVYTIIETYRGKNFYAQVEADIKKSSLDTVFKEKLLEGFREGKAAGMKVDKQWWDLEENIVDQTANALKFLQRKKDAWEIRNGAIDFKNPADAATYNGYLDKAKALTNQQSAIEQNHNTKFAITMKKLDNL